MPEVRPDLALFGGYHSPQIQVEVRLNTNESPMSPPQAFLDELAEAIRAIEFNRYPDRSASKLRSALAELHGMSPDEVFIANGSNEVISTILLAYGGPGRTAMTFEPTYAMYSQLAKITSTALVEVDRNDRFQLEAGTVEAALARVRPEVVFFCSPNNPTGLDEDPSIVVKTAESCDALVVIDEAYGQFASFDALALTAGHSNVVVSKTFSKVWSLAGLRLGYVLGPADIIGNLWAACLPYHVDTLKQEAGLLALRHLEEMNRTLGVILDGRKQIESGLVSMGLEFWQSSSNFVLFRAPAGAGEGLWAKLVEKSVLVRNCSTWPRLKDCLRVTVGTSQENARFLSALSESLEELRS